MDKHVMVTLDRFEEAEKYWLDKLSGELGDLRLPLDFPETGQYESAVYKRTFDTEVTENVIRISKNNDLSLYIMLLTFYKILLFKYTYSGQNDIITASPVYSESSRKYNKFVVFKDTLHSSMTFKEALMRVKQTVVESYKNEHYPFSNLGDSLGLKQENVSLFTRHAVILEDIHKKESIDDMKADTAADIVFSVRKNTGGLEGDIVYNSKLFKQGSIERFFAAYHCILEQMLADTDMAIGDVELTTGEEKEQLLFRFNDTEKKYPQDKPIHRFFEEQVKQTPGNIAVRSTIDIQNIYDKLKNEKVDIWMTYEELNAEANQLAAELRIKGVKPDCIVGLMVQHPLELVKGILGILKAGGAYLPIDPQYPQTFKEYILQESNVQLLVSETALIDTLTPLMHTGMDPSLSVILVDDIDSSHSTSNNDWINDQSDLAYAVYTSGTTGKAKGTLVRHGGIVNFALWRLEFFGYTEEDVTLQPLSVSFDGFGSNFYSSLLSGGALVMVPDSKRMDYNYVKEAIIENRVTNVSLVPGIYGVLLEAMEKDELQSLRFVVLGGESSWPGLIKKSKEKAPHALLVNEYGPSEATVAAVAYSGIEETGTAIIGTPISNTHVYILDKNRKLAPINVPGECCIGGRGVARGYLNKPELTAENFDQDFQDYPDEKGKKKRRGKYSSTSLPLYPSTSLYHTSDTARWLPNGNIEFLGRRDNQVKIRGHRIELEQVEAELVKHDNIKEAVVLAGEREGNAFLCAYVVPQSPDTFRAADFRDYLDQRLPYYMVPSYFVPLERIPLTANGKLNRRALPQPESGKTGEEYVAPTNKLEKQLADILKEVLKLDKVGINDNFFDIGGNSLNFVQVNEKLKEVWGKDIPIVVMFQYPTIRSLCTHLNDGEKNESLSQKENEHEAFKKVGDTMEEAVELFDNL